MASIFEPSDIPAWMNPSRAALESGQQSAAGFGRNFSASFSQSQQEKAAQNLLKQKQTMLQEEQQRKTAKATGVAGFLKDAKSPEEAWRIVSEHPEWLADPDTAPFVGQYLKAQADVARAEYGSVAGKIKIEATKDIARRATALKDKQAAATVMEMQDPERQRAALSQFEQAQGIVDQMRRDIAVAESELRGDTKTTTITDKGVTQTYRSVPASGSSTKPEEMTLSSGEKIVYNPKTGAFQFKGDNFTKAQFLAIANARLKQDAEDADAKKIIDFVTKGALEQIGGGSTNKVLDYDPKTGTFK